MCASSITTKSQSNCLKVAISLVAYWCETIITCCSRWFLQKCSNFEPLFCRISAITTALSTTNVGKLNFSASSFAHCFRKIAGQTISSLRFRSAHIWQITKPASMVFPKPTSSASKTPSCSGFLSANNAASI